MLVDGDAATVVGDSTVATVLVQGDFNLAAMPGQILVDRVVDDLPQQVMQALTVDSSDIHRRPHADGFQTFENFNIAGAVS